MSYRRNFPARISISHTLVVLFPLLLHLNVVFVSSEDSNNTIPWKTLSGNPPLVVARGGFSGLFPDSSSYAYNIALLVSVPDVILWCDVQLTKDGVGICIPDLILDNSTNAPNVLAGNLPKTYLVNGVPNTGFFTIDFNLQDLSFVSLVQGNYDRSSKFDGNGFQILTVKDVAKEFKPPGFWLNIQHDAFFTQHNLSMRNFVINASRSVIINYISSPEVGFLTSIAARFKRSTTKLVFRFLGQDDIELTTNQTYGSLLRNLTFIKTFASGILVPKTYIWPIDKDGYLLSQSSLVSDAHKAQLEVFASEFYNDLPLSYNYSYDPITEYLSYIENDKFSVDGVLTDFPVTPSAAINCFAHLDKNAKIQDKPLVISKFGASGDYPACTDLSYTNAILDGTEVLDCPVQITKDGIPICLSSINLIDSTTVSQTPFSSRSKEIPEIKSGDGIFAFDLTWEEIQSLTPSILNPFSRFKLFRNPKFRNRGTFLTLSEFLALAKNASTLSGVLINIEYAPYLAKDQGLSLTDAVRNALSEAGYDNQTTLKVMLQSTDSSVLINLKNKNKSYELVYEVDESISDVLNSTVEDITKFADSMVVSKTSIYPLNSLFLTGATNVVPKLQSFNLSVYVQTLSNEFVSQAWDFFSDTTVEINSFFMGANVDGIITDFPKTSARYKKNRCFNRGKDVPNYMSPVKPGSLFKLVTAEYLPPQAAPNPILDDKDVVESPLPTVATPPPAGGGSSTAVPTTPPNGQPNIAGGFFLLNFSLLVIPLFLL